MYSKCIIDVPQDLQQMWVLLCVYSLYNDFSSKIFNEQQGDNSLRTTLKTHLLRTYAMER